MKEATPEQIVAFMLGGKMPDIIERLRSKSPYLDGSSAERTMEKAADFIERQGDRLVEITTELLESEAEIERLRTLAAIVREQGFEIERLRATLAEIAAHDDQFSSPQQARAMRDAARRALEGKP